MLQEKAKEFAMKMSIRESCHFSDGWLHRFKNRHGIRRLDVSGEAKSADLPSAEEFIDRFAKLVSEHDLTPEQVYNADETGLLYRCLPTSTLASEAEGAAKGFKQSKDRLTVHVFVPSVKENLKKKGLPEDSKVVLLLDNCKAHPPAEVLSMGNIIVVYLPPNVTSVIQPMDQGVIQNFKVNYRRSFMRKLVNYDDGSISEFQRAFNVKDAIFMASLAWQDVKQQTLKRSWRKLYPLVMFVEEEGDEDFEGFAAVRRKPAVSESREMRGAAVVSELREMGGAAKLNPLSRRH
ncbi:hypothetical protein Pcinc_031507 [Petrolisthes cinctipes]|uniref:HTH CENPB-type domain-containing protein n=1 Tax=Petrolisthes cinctipes TaxID=88211 RepID=A0AAE1EW80_PETCI|nr:hypothetical protein Pcinc_031507 [Petrolisthes cinctipes]